MTKFYKHIAIFLIGIFVIPIVSQSIHILWHHSHSVIVCNHTIYLKNAGHHIGDTNIINEKNKQCPICEYKFSINNLPVISVFGCSIPKINVSDNESEITQPTSCLVVTKSPRAPPFWNI